MTDPHWLELSGHTTPSAPPPDHDATQLALLHAQTLTAHDDLLRLHTQHFDDHCRDLDGLNAQINQLQAQIAAIPAPLQPALPALPPDHTERIKAVEAQLKAVNFTMSEVLKKTLFDQGQVRKDLTAQIERLTEVGKIQHGIAMEQIDRRPPPATVEIPSTSRAPSWLSVTTFVLTAAHLMYQIVQLYF